MSRRCAAESWQRNSTSLRFGAATAHLGRVSGDVLIPPQSDGWLFDRGVPFYVDGVFAGYIGSCTDVHARVEAEAALERHQAVEMDRLQRLLPVCAWCGRIRNDQGYWKSVTEYLKEHGFGPATHGICMRCEEEVVVDSDGG